MTSFLLKIIACISMFCDHLRYLIPSHPLFMSFIGRLAFPIFAFQITEGYAHTKNLKKYFLKLFIFAIISQIPFQLYFDTSNFNVIFTLFLGLLSIYIYDNMKKNKSLSFILIGCLLVLSELLHTDYSFYGIILILIFHIFKNKKGILILSYILITLLYFFVKYNYFWLSLNYIILLICTLVAIIPCLLYNGKQGKKVKYLIYIFYPAHLLILFMLTHF